MLSMSSASQMCGFTDPHILRDYLQQHPDQLKTLEQFIHPVYFQITPAPPETGEFTLFPALWRPDRFDSLSLSPDGRLTHSQGPSSNHIRCAVSRQEEIKLTQVLATHSITEKNLQDLCLSLVRCEKEADVIALLKQYGLWDNPDNWRHFGDNENNFATVGNQQARPETALVEKLINAVDAVMMGVCLARNIDPTSTEAPRSMKEGLAQFFRMFEGKLSNLIPSERERLADNISLVSSGSKSEPCYSIIDRGEGQTPAAMPWTLCSLGRSNKLRIPFVQGKFNMGGTGVLQFCGTNNLQLIISRRNPAIRASTDEKNAHHWSFTVVRRVDPDATTRSSAYKYLVLDGQVLSFPAEALPLLPGQYPESFGKDLTHGTFIKLYEYQLPSNLRGESMTTLYDRLSVLMPGIALPVRVYERRQGYTGPAFEKTLAGFHVLLEEDEVHSLEPNFPYSASVRIGGEELKVAIYAFKKGAPIENYFNGDRVLFTVNGQTHGHFPQAFFSRKEVGMGYLADSLLVIVDCSNLSGRAREDLFMNSRDRLRQSRLRREIEGQLEALLASHSALRELRATRREEEIQEKLTESGPLVETLNRIIERSPGLATLFAQGERISNPFKARDVTGVVRLSLRQFPRTFTLEKKYSAGQPKSNPSNVPLRVRFVTDVVNNYFDRDKDPGIFSLKMNGREVASYSIQLCNGEANLSIKLPAGIKVGDVLEFESSVTDVVHTEPFTDRFFVRVDPPSNAHPGGKKPKPRDPHKPFPGSKPGTVTKSSDRLDIPQVVEVRRDEWSRHSFDSHSAVKVVASEDGYDVFVNMDNVHLLSEEKGNASTDPRVLQARYKYAMALTAMALLRETQDETTRGSEERDVYTEVGRITKALAPIFLPMISSLGDLNVDSENGER